MEQTKSKNHLKCISVVLFWVYIEVTMDLRFTKYDFQTIFIAFCSSIMAVKLLGQY